MGVCSLAVITSRLGRGQISSTNRCGLVPGVMKGPGVGVSDPGTHVCRVRGQPIGKGSYISMHNHTAVK